MGKPVVHFEIIGSDPAGLRSYYGNLFGWEFDPSGPVSAAVSQPDDYGFVDHDTTSDGVGFRAAAARATRLTSCSTSVFPT